MSSNSSSIKRAMAGHTPRPQLTFNKKILLVIALLAWVLGSFILVNYLVLFATLLLEGVGVPFDSFNEFTVNTILSSIIYLLTLVLVIGVPMFKHKQHTTIKDVGLHRLPSWWDLLLTVAGFIAYFILSAAVVAVAVALVPSIDFAQAQETGFSGISERVDYIMAFIALVIIAPIAEEVLFRGYLLGKIRKYAPTWLAILLTSVAFAVAHFQVNVGLDVFALSIVLCVLRVYTGSLWPAILIHMAKNGLAYYLLFVYVS